MPPGESGKHGRHRLDAASRCTSRPRRSTRTSRRRTSTGSPGRRPARSSSTPSRCRRRPTPTAEPGDPLGKEVKAGWDELVKDGGLTLYPDWSSPTMLQTMGQSFQEMLAGRISPQDVITQHPERLGGVPPGARGGLAGGGASRPRRVRDARTRRRRGRGRPPTVRVRAPGEPRRVAYLYLAPAFALLPAVRVRRRCSTRRGCRSSTGTGSRSARGSASTTTTRC